MIYILGLLITLILKSTCIEVNFEAGDSGFFLKHYRQPPTETFVQYKNGSYMKEKVPHDIVLSTDRFTVTETNQPVSIRASYGPFSTKQTVPARYIVPEVSGVNKDYQNNTTAALYDLQNSNLHLDISAHLVRTSIPQDSPVLRVMFHAGADPTGHLQRQKVCVSLHVSLGGSDAVKGRCIPDGEDGVCVAEVLIPTNWWPNPQNVNNVNSAQKVPTRHVQVAYSVFEPPLKNPEHCEPKVQVQPLTPFAEVGLVPPQSNYKEKFADDVLSIFLPNSPLYPLSKLYVPVFLRQPKANRISTVIMRARIKTGFKILGAKASSDSWSISLEKESPKYVICKVTAFKIEEKQKMTSFANSSQIIEGTFPIFSWLFEVTNDVNGAVDYGKIVFSVNYVYSEPIKELNNESTNHVKKKIIAKYEINKDDIQAVLPMAKNWELINTAVLTGRQVAQAMKVFIVSEAGKIADVTLQSFCHAEDESVIKVSSSCSSVYVDGSEIRGSSNASIIVKYGTYLGLAKFVVWMPEFPLEVYLSDFRLSQIKGWKILDDAQNLYGKKFRRRKKRSAYLKPKNDSVFNPDQMEKHVCKARYQQSSVEVYSRFIAIDQNSGRISYFISRRTSLRVTDIVQPLLRVSDPKVANLQGRVLQGKSMGRAEVQVLSPITGRVIGAKEVRVGSDKISLTKINVRVISGLQLSIYPDNSVTNGYLAETSVTQKLTAQYQEGLLDIDLEFSDGTKTPLRDVAVDDYVLLVESMDSEIVAFAPMLASHHPRVIAVGEGHGRLLRVSMLLAEDCRMRRSFANIQNLKSVNSPLASALAFVEVDFNNLETITQHDTVQNDGIVNKDKSVLRNIEDLSDIIGIPIKDSSYGRGTYIDSHRFRDSFHRNNDIYMKKKGIMTSVEFGIFVLLTAFCFAIVIFVITCVVYASKFRTMSVDHTSDTEHTKNPHKLSQNDVCTNAHDWVWLGRSTMEKSIANRDDLDTSARHFQIKITDNPIENFSNIKMSHRDSVHGKEERSLKNNQHETSYKPPVPPHRNLSTQLFDDNVKVGNPSAALCSNGNRVPIVSNVGNEDNNKLSISYVKKHNAELLVDFPKNCKLNAFQFDNTLPTHQANKSERSKRASVVGNPMFANNIAADSEPEQNLSFDCLDMDYEQIMHYFDNLKESNA